MIEVQGQRVQAYSTIPWPTDAATSFRALTPQPPLLLPSLALRADKYGSQTPQQAPDKVDEADFMRFDKGKRPLVERPQSQKTGYLGSVRMSRRELQLLSQKLKEVNVQLIIDKKGILPEFARAGFDPTAGKLYLRKGATHFEAFHETQHAQQWAILRRVKYLQQTRLEREKYVFDRIVENRNSFSKAEIIAATKYIETLS